MVKNTQDDSKLPAAPQAKKAKTERTGASSEQEARREEGADELEEKEAVPADPAPIQWEDDTVMPFPAKLPMQVVYEAGSHFYVRECYSKYYDEIIRLLTKEDMRVITVTGTPGIGKSVFYAYFLLRYMYEYPDATVVTASFSMREMQGVAVWEKGKKPDTKSAFDTTDSDMAEFIVGANKAAGKDRIIHLYDGPPKRAPPEAKMVCFTSPNESWLLSDIKKTNIHTAIFMPLWELEELREAALVLDLQMKTTEDESASVVWVGDHIEERFHLFGGVARFCLETKPRSVKSTLKEVNRKINSLQKVQDVENLLNQEEGAWTHHIICHYAPTEDMSDYAIVPSSLYVRRRLVERLSKMIGDKRNNLIACLDGCSAAAQLRGNLFEEDAHELLKSGCTIEVQSLSSSSSDRDKLQVEIEASPSYEKFDSNFDASILENEGPYHAPKADNLASVDSFYYRKDDGILLLFQMTVSMTHPVKGDGLVNLLKRLDLLKAVQEKSQLVKLIFVVPEKNAPNFRRQDIVFDTADDSDNVAQLKTIGKKRAGDLNQEGIHTIGDLRAALDKAEADGLQPKQTFARSLSLHCFREIIANHGAAPDRLALKKMLDRIPQFVWGSLGLCDQYAMP